MAKTWVRYDKRKQTKNYYEMEASNRTKSYNMNLIKKPKLGSIIVNQDGKGHDGGEERIRNESE